MTALYSVFPGVIRMRSAILLLVAAALAAQVPVRTGMKLGDFILPADASGGQRGSRVVA